ncbi:MAG: hypothetical protein MSA09_01875, partial [Lachnospiraceae bacterium]|nr:hypothetical protein [Lachnospiraceae bacterium]
HASPLRVKSKADFLGSYAVMSEGYFRASPPHKRSVKCCPLGRDAVYGWQQEQQVFLFCDSSGRGQMTLSAATFA